jgi:hypothetical protein
MGPVYLFVLVATAVGTADAGPPGSQTIGYYATAAECQMDLIRLSKTVDQSRVKLDCQPMQAVP